MLMLHAIIRPKRSAEVLGALKAAGFRSVTRASGEQGHETLCLVVEDADANRAIKAIHQAARTGRRGDGKIFVTKVVEAYSIRNGQKKL